MKCFRFPPMKGILLLLVGSMALSFAENDGKRLSREELLELLEKSSERMSRLKLQSSKTEQMHPSQSSILDRSVILNDGRKWTLIPKGSLLAIPEAHQQRVNAQPGTAKYVEFSSFLLRNRGWLSTHAVTLEQARGNQRLNTKAVEVLQKSGRVVISVYQGGPITTRAFKEKKDGSNTSTAQN